MDCAGVPNKVTSIWILCVYVWTRWVLAKPPRTPRHPHLLRLVSGQEVHGRLSNLHQRHERQDPEGDQHQQPLRLQAHQQPQGQRLWLWGSHRLGMFSPADLSNVPVCVSEHGPLRRHRAQRGDGVSWNDAERLVQGAVWELVHRQEERSHHRWILCRGNTR